MRTTCWRLRCGLGTTLGNPQGIALIMTLVFIAVLTLVGAAAVTMGSTDVLLGGAYHSSLKAFHHAQAGVQFAAAKIPDLVQDGQLQLDGSALSEDAVFTRPPELAFEISDRRTLQRIGETRKYLLQVTGLAHAGSRIQTTVEVVLQRRRALDYGLFAADRLDLPARGRIYSYDSRTIKSGRNPAASSGQVQLAAGGSVTAQAAHLDLGVDGEIMLGETPHGGQAQFAFREASADVPPPPTRVTTGGDNELHLLPGGALETDPLDVADMVNEAKAELRLENDNDAVKLGDYQLSGQSRQLGAGDYYFTEMTLNAGQFLWLNAKGGDINIYADAINIEAGSKLKVLTDGRGQSGTVNIYLDGPAAFGSAAGAARFQVTGDAASFRLFSSSSEPIDFHHQGDLKGLIYAPYAPVSVQNGSARGYGLVWSDRLNFSHTPSPYTFYTDTAIQELFLSKAVQLVSWKALQD